MSTIKTNTISNVAGSKTVPTDTVVDGSAKAWVNFNGTGTPAIRAAFNVTSITDNGTGDYTVNFTTALADANYCYAAFCDFQIGTNNSPRGVQVQTVASGSLRIRTVDSAATLEDEEAVAIAIFR
jgi:hypothetical protein